MKLQIPETKPKKRFSWVTVFSVVLFVIGLVLMFNKPIRNMLIAKQIDNHKITKISKKQLQKNNGSKDAVYDFDAVRPVSSEAVIQDMLDNSSPASFITIAGIAIPDLEMNLPIYKGVDDTSLLYGAGTMKPEQELGKGNYALASHSMFGYANGENLLFSPLARAKKGMMIYLTDLTDVYSYEITSIDIVNPDAGYVINDEPGKTQVTLVTCTDANATQRIIVKGELRDKRTYANSSEKVKKAFNHSYTGV